MGLENKFNQTEGNSINVKKEKNTKNNHINTNIPLLTGMLMGGSITKRMIEDYSVNKSNLIKDGLIGLTTIGLISTIGALSKIPEIKKINREYSSLETKERYKMIAKSLLNGAENYLTSSSKGYLAGSAISSFLYLLFHQ